jgi:hypothetical protein
MELRTISTFNSTIPDDTQWDDNDETSVPGGKSIAGILRDFLRSTGTKCSDPAVRDAYGWEMMAESGGHRYLIVVQIVDQWILQCEPVSNPHFEPTAAMLRLITRCLSSDPRFSNVRWFQSSDFERGDLSKASERPC